MLDYSCLFKCRYKIEGNDFNDNFFKYRRKLGPFPMSGLLNRMIPEVSQKLKKKSILAQRKTRH